MRRRRLWARRCGKGLESRPSGTSWRRSPSRPSWARTRSTRRASRPVTTTSACNGSRADCAWSGRRRSARPRPFGRCRSGADREGRPGRVPVIAAQLVVNSLLAAGPLAIAALGLALVFGVMRIINFAHGELVTIGAYATWLLVLAGMSPLIGLPVAFVVGALLGAATDRAIVRPLARRPELDLLIGTYGLSV